MPSSTIQQIRDTILTEIRLKGSSETPIALIVQAFSDMDMVEWCKLHQLISKYDRVNQCTTFEPIKPSEVVHEETWHDRKPLFL
jgi:hypothetical protein